jgi:hypothetical protein
VSTLTASNGSNNSTTPTSVAALDPIFGVHVYSRSAASSVSSSNVEDDAAAARSWLSWLPLPGSSPSRRSET